jgi:hypothetical protein
MMRLAAVVIYLFLCGDLQEDPEALSALPLCQHGDDMRFCGLPLGGFGCALTPDRVDFVLDPTSACLNGSGNVVPDLPTGPVTYAARAYAFGRFRIDDADWSDGEHTACVRLSSSATGVKDQFLIPISKGFDARRALVPPPPFDLRPSQ